MPVRPRRERVVRRQALALTPDIDLALLIGPHPLLFPDVERLAPYFRKFRSRYGEDSWGARHFEQSAATALELRSVAA